MKTAFIVPFLAAGGFGLVAPVAARWLPGRAAVWLCTLCAVAVVTGCWVSAGALVITTFGQLPQVAAHGRWAPAVVGEYSPAPFALGVAATAALSAVTAYALLCTSLELRRLIWAWRSCRKRYPSLLVVQAEEMFAFAIPGWPGRIVASHALLRGLDPRERRAVLAHEQAHLDQHHELHLLVATFCAHANPLLIRVPDAMRLACERWADDRAAAAVGDRRTVARAITRAASTASGSLTALAAGGSNVPARVTALLSPPDARRARVIEGALLAAMLLTAAAAAWVSRDVDRIFDAASIGR